MALVDEINRFLQLFIDAFGFPGRGRVWRLLFLYFLLNWLLLHAHYNFLSPLFYTIVINWVSLFDAEKAVAFTHYPEHLLLLARFFGWAKLAVGLAFEGLVLAAAAILFGRHFVGRSNFESIFKMVVPKWGHLVLAWAVINGLVFAAGEFLPEWFVPFLTSPRRQLAFTLVVLPSALILVFAPFFFAIPSIAVLNDNVVRAVRRSLTIFGRNPLQCLFLTGLILVVPIMVYVLTQRPPAPVRRLGPEFVYWLLLAGLIAEMIARFFWMGTAVRFLADEEH